MFWLLLVAFSIALLAHAYVGSFSRMLADDYCFTAVLQEHGFWGFQKDYFQTQNGRFAGALAMTFGFRGHGKLIPYLPGIAIVLWVSILAWGIVQWQRIAGKIRSILAALVLAESIVVATLVLMSVTFQSLYWASGMLNYLPPLMLVPLYAGLVSKGIRASKSGCRAAWFALSFVTAFFGAGFSETAFTLQLALLSLTIIAIATNFVRLPKRATLSFLFGGLVASALATAVRLSAPGNHARLAMENLGSEGKPARSLLALVTCTLRFGLESLHRSIFTSRSTTAAIVLLSAIVAFHLADLTNEKSAESMSRQRLLLWLVALPLLAFVLVLSCYLPAGYIAAYVHAGFVPPPRLAVAPQFAFFSCACAWGYLLGIAMVRVLTGGKNWTTTAVSWGSVILVIAILVVPLNDARHTLEIAPTMRHFAREWDGMDRTLRAAKQSGSTRVEIPLLPHTLRYQNRVFLYSVHVLDSDPTNWVNECAEQYYGLDSIVAHE